MKFYKKIITILTELTTSHPDIPLGRHIATAIDSQNMNDLWATPDKELHNNLLNYQAGLDMDIPHHDDDLENIIRDGENLYNVGFDEYEE
jgi:hypothetical protein